MKEKKLEEGNKFDAKFEDNKVDFRSRVEAGKFFR